MLTPHVTLGAQTSGEDDRTINHVLELRGLLAEHCVGPYCPSIDEFALILRIGGVMQEFDFVGCERLRRNRKERYITVDLGFPSAQWKGRSDQHIREFLLRAVQEGLLACVRRLEADNEPVRSKALESDLLKVREQFISDRLGGTSDEIQSGDG